jgi:hypothetical protein
VVPATALLIQRGRRGHVGLQANGAFADRLAVGVHCRQAFRSPGSGCPCTAPGKVLVPAMLMLTSGGEACADIERLRLPEGALFGSVPSDSTLYRTCRSISSHTISELWAAMAEAGRCSRRPSVRRQLA